MNDQPSSAEVSAKATAKLRWAVFLGALTAITPASIDLYLPALPRLSQHFGVSESTTQLTLTGYLVGLAIGHVFVGPWSDAAGRRRPLLVGLTVYVVMSAGCAAAPSADILVGLRLVQGAAGAVGMVIARAIVRDLYSGTELARFLSSLMVVNALAPILAPMIGGQAMRIMPWQGLFLLLAGYGLILLIVAATWLPETLTRKDRRAGPPAMLGAFGTLTKNRQFTCYALAGSLPFAAMFCYIAGSSFALQRLYGLSPQLFSVVFGVNALGIALAAQISRFALRRFSAQRVLAFGLILATAGGVELVVATAFSLGLPAILTGLFASVAANGVIIPNATALALAGEPAQAGSASALFGIPQYVFAAGAAPLVGAMETTTALPMAMLMCALYCSGLIAYGLAGARRRNHDHAGSP